MSELVEFLRVRLSEDEADARANRGTYPSAVAWEDGRVALHAHEDGSAVIVRLGRPVERPGELIGLKRWSLPVTEGWTASRILREVEAKRAILEQYLRAFENRREHPGDLGASGALLALHGACKALALPYADHADYKPEWAV